jgi:hypothetical protein
VKAATPRRSERAGETDENSPHEKVALTRDWR